MHKALIWSILSKLQKHILKHRSYIPTGCKDLTPLHITVFFSVVDRDNLTTITAAAAATTAATTTTTSTTTTTTTTTPNNNDNINNIKL